MKEHYDIIVIGAGPGGYSAAVRASELGKNAAVIDLSKDRVGGTCLNEGCIPVKSIIQSSRLSALSGRDIGYAVTESKKIIAQFNVGIHYLFKKNNVTFIEGKARLINNKEAVVRLAAGGELEVTADYFILAAGSKTKPAPGFEFDGKRVVSSIDAINLKQNPKDVTIIGAGAIGVEFAWVFSNFGSRVTIVEMVDRILPQDDPDISSGLSGILTRKGVEIITGKRITIGDIKSELILIAAGRIPNTDDLGLAEAGIELDNGFIKVDSSMRTSIDNIFAVGDLINTPMFAHVASFEGTIAAELICGLEPERINYLNVPRVVYGNTETASIGFTEKEVIDNNLKLKTIKYYFKANSRSVINGHSEGFIKIIAEEETGAFLGVHILGSKAAEIIHPFIVAKTAGLSTEEVSRIVFAHPTVSEAVRDACLPR